MGKISDALEKAKKIQTDEQSRPQDEPANRDSQFEEQGHNNDLVHNSGTPVADSGREMGAKRKVAADADDLPVQAKTEITATENKSNVQEIEEEGRQIYSPPQKAWDERLYKAVHEDIYLPEIFKVLRSRILLPGDNVPVPKSIMITSVEPKEGKSFIAANLGVSLAQGMDQHCLLVNCDLRRPSISSLFGLQGDIGLADYLRGEQKLGDIIQKTSIGKLSIIASGKIPSNPAELLASSRMGDLIAELAQRYNDRIVIYDCPPFQFVPETNVLAKLVDKIILVIRQAGAGRYELKKLIDKLGREKFLGLVFNGHTTNIVDRSLMKGYGSYASSYYAGAYE